MFVKFLSVLSVLICAANGTQDICYVDGINSLNWLHKSSKIILDNYEGVIEKFPMLNIDNAFIEDCKYLQASVDNENIVISTTADFGQIEECEDEIPITATLVTVCAGEESRTKYILELKDTNNHAPKFEEEVYEYIFYDVIPNAYEFDLNEFKEVAAVDVDFSNEKVVFTIEDNDYLKLKDEGVRDSGELRRFVANLVLKQDIAAPITKTFVITATDSGEPPLSTSAEIKIIVLRSEAPLFTRSLYEAHVTKDRRVVMDDEDIALENVTSYDDMHFDISPQYAKFFDLKVEDIIKIELSEGQNPLALVLEDDPTLAIAVYAEGQELGIYAETTVLLNMEELLENADIIANATEVTSTSEEDNPTVEEVTTNSKEEDVDLDKEPTDSKEDSTDSKEDDTPETKPSPEYTTESDQTTLRSGPSFVYTELRGLRYWLNVNKAYIILFTVLTSCAIIVFFCISIRRSNVRIR